MNGTTELNKTLQRQLRKVYGNDIPSDPKLLQLLEQVSQTYAHFDEDRILLERSMELSSFELNEANQKLRNEAEGQRVLLSILQDAISVLDGQAPRSEDGGRPINPGELVKQAGHLRRIAEEQKRIENLLRQQEARMDEAQRLANFGNWAYDFKSGIVTWSPQMWVIYGRDRSLPAYSSQEHSDACHADDRSMVDERLLELKQKPVVSLQHRIVRPDGSVRWVDTNIKILREPSTGKGTGMVGTVIDITERKLAEIKLAQKITELRETTGFLDTLIDNLPVMLIVKEASSLRYVRFNKTACSMSGRTQEEVLGKNANDLYPPEQARIYNRQDMEVLVSGEMIVERDEPFLQADGSQRLLHTRKIPIFDSTGQIKYLMTISEDITEQRLGEEKMRAAAEAAEEANRAKSAFLSSMSHELRTPLNAIIGFAQILQRDRSIPDQQRGYVETMYRSGNHLLDMINDVLDLSKIEAGRFELVLEPFDLHQLVKDAASLFTLKAAEKQLAFTLSIDETVPRQTTGDAKRISQILINLIGNALKFTDQGSVDVHVKSERIPNTSSVMVQFNVSDTGRGIPKDQQTLIFEPFRQVRGFYSEGTGLGLAICSRLAGMLDGAMGVESELDKGSRFWLELPLETTAAALEDNSEDYLPVTGIADNRKWRILIVDDIASNRAVVRALLELVGFEVVEAGNGRDAIQMAELFRPDVIFMDIMMPVMDGVESTHRIRLHDWGSRIKIIALTASGSSDRRKELVQEGFDDYIPKPFKEQWIFSALERHSGIRFIREQRDSTTTNGKEHSTMQAVLSFVNALDPAERNALTDAAEMLDFQSILHVIRPHLIRSEHAREIARNATSQNNLFFLNLSDMITE